MTRSLHSSDFFEFQLPGDPQLSPDGEQVAFVLQTHDRGKDRPSTSIWSIPARGGTPRRLTSGNDDRSPRWSPDGRFLSFVSSRSGKPQVWIMPTAGGESWVLPTEQAVESAAEWSPQGDSLAFSAPTFSRPQDWIPYAGAPRWDRKRAELATEQRTGGGNGKHDDLAADRAVPAADVKVITEIKHKLDGVGFWGDGRAQLYVMDFQEPEPGLELAPGARQVTSAPYHHLGPSWSPDGEYLACTSYQVPDEAEHISYNVYAVNVQNGDEYQLTKGKGKAFEPSWSPDGRYLAFIGNDSHVSDYTTVDELYLLRFDEVLEGPVEKADLRAITSDLERPVGSIIHSDVRYSPPQWMTSPKWSADHVFFTVIDHGTSYLMSADVSRIVTGGVPTPTVDAELPDCTLTQVAGAEGFNLAFFDIRNGVTVFQGCETQTVDELYALVDGQLRPLTSFNAHFLDEVRIAPVERFTYSGADEWEIDGWVLRPVGVQSPAPYVLFIHGGPHGAYGDTFNFMMQVLASNGIGVLYTNPRGSIGCGQDFAAACVGDWGGKDFEDLMAGVDYIVDQGWADPDRLGVTGWSFGGFMTCWTVTQTDRFRAASTGACIANLHSFFGTSDIGFNFGVIQPGGIPWEDADWLLERSPVSHVENVTTPIMVVHGEADLRCPIEQSEQFYTSLKALGKEAVFVRYPGEYHAITKSSHREDRFERALAWFEHYLGGQ